MQTFECTCARHYPTDRHQESCALRAPIEALKRLESGQTVQLYNVVRYFKSNNRKTNRKIVLHNVTLKTAQEHCNDEKTRSSDWFDGYEKVQ